MVFTLFRPPTRPPSAGEQSAIFVVVAILGVLSCVFVGMPFWQGRNTGMNPNGEYVEVKGAFIVEITEPWQTTAEIRSYLIQSNHQIRSEVIRSNNQVSTLEPGVRLSDSLWSDIEALRQDWCLHPPATKRPPRLGTGYRIVLVCHPTRNPILYFPIGQLDPRLQAAIDAVK